MKAVFLLGEEKLEIQEVPDPAPGPGEVILEIRASGMCGTDLKVYRAVGGAAAMGLPGAGSDVIGGHEPCGIIAETGSGVSERMGRVGDRVMNHHYAGCGACFHCRGGWTQMCDEGAVVFGLTGHGAHAKYMRVPADSLVPLPETLSYQTGAAISCGTGTAWGALERLDLKGMETIAIFGMGPVGMSGAMLASAMGARVIALDIDADRLERAKAFGADLTINPNETDPVEAILDATGGLGVECAMETSSSTAARTQACRAARKWGRVVNVGEGGEITLDASRDLNRKQLNLMGSWTFSKNQQAACAKFVADRRLDVDSLFTHSWPIDQAGEAYRLFNTQTTGKGFIVPS